MAKREDIKKVLIIGSGPIVIGQACEFDYSGTQACKALSKLGYKIILVNSNPATIMTDPGMADVTYIEPLNAQTLTEIIENEKPDAVLPNLGGQTGLNLTSELHRRGILEKHGVKVIGVQVDAIERGEDRIAFKEAMNKLGIEMPKSKPATSVEEAEKIAAEMGYPVVIRPAYTMGGTGGGIVYNLEELRLIASRGVPASLHRPDSDRRIRHRLGGAGTGSRPRRKESHDHRLLYRERRCDGCPHGRFLLHRADADHFRRIAKAPSEIFLRHRRRPSR